MISANGKTINLIQSRLSDLLGSAEARLKFYCEVVERRLEETEHGSEVFLRVPRSYGLRLRLPGKPFHATPEIFFQEAGTTRFALPEENLTVGPRQAALSPAGMPHGETWKGPAFVNVIMMFQEDGFSLHLGYLEDRLRCGPIDRFRTSVRLNFIRYAEEIASTEAKRPGSQIRRGLYLAFLARLREGLTLGTVSEEGNHPLLRRCLELVDSHFTRMDFSVIWLARELGCSPDHLSRLFRRQAGQRLMQFIHQKRTKYAGHLLRESEMNIAETAWACGFSQPSYFNRIFRAYTGLSPHQFRREVQAGPASVPLGLRPVKQNV